MIGMDTQQRIVEAAIAVFNDDLSAPLERVAEKAMVTRRTLHRYFRDRTDLITACGNLIQKSCSMAMEAALNSSDRPLEQLEQMLYAGIDCGVKYAFFHKLHNREGHQHQQQKQGCAEYDAMYKLYQKVVAKLQKEGIVSRYITAEWIFMFFTGVIGVTVNADANSVIAEQSLRKFAWYSFSKGIGV